MPARVQANFLSDLFGQDAYAESNIIKSPQSGSNSQNIELLQANVSSSFILQDKDNKKDDIPNTKNTNTNIVSSTALLSATGPMGVSDGTNNPDSSLEETSVYVVRKGDTVAAISKMFDVSVNTILAANDLKKGTKLVEGDVLFILPVSGVEHTIKKGQTLKGIAKLYKVGQNDIALYNGITEDTSLNVGDKLMIPGADMNDEGGDKPAPNLSTAPSRDKKYYEALPQLKNLVDYFINPVPTGHKTQGLHGPGKRGIDIGAPKGTPIYAAASGTVSLAHTGWSGGYGNMVILEHPNGTKTLYGHMTKIITYTGAHVEQGEVIGLVGSTGRSTGPHLHFEVFSARNPGVDYSWKN